MNSSTRAQPGSLVLVAVATLGIGCAPASQPNLSTEPPLVRGPVESIAHHATATGILVRAGPRSREPCGIQATADAETRYLRRTGEGGLEPAERSEVAVGDTVEIYVAGPVRESCPVQARAAAVVLVSAAAVR